MRRSITPLIVAALIAGAIVGLILHRLIVDPQQLAGVTNAFSLVTEIFLRLIRMIIGPLVLSTLTVGVARMGDPAAVGRIGLKAMIWFVVASLSALLLAICAMLVLRPGMNLHLTGSATADPSTLATLTVSGFIAHIIPTSIFDALAHNEVLQITVFSLFAGMALTSLQGPGRAELLDTLAGIAAMMLKMTRAVMWVAPVAVFAAVASAAASQGMGVIRSYLGFVLDFYCVLALLWLVLIGSGALIIGRRIGPLMKAIRGPALIAFSTTSSEAAYPSLLVNLELFGVPNRIASFVLPLGYAFNLVGSMLYATMATLFAAAAYDVPMPPGQIALMAFLLFIASKGIALVPRASLLVVAATLPYLHIPESAFPFLLAVDHLLDMGRTCTNTVANALATVTVARWEGALTQGGPSEDLEIAMGR